MSPKIVPGLPMLAIACFALGCSDGTGPSEPLGVTLSFAVKAPQPARSVAGVSAALVPVADASGRKIEIQSVEAVLVEIKLARAEAGGDCNLNAALCADFRTGPVLVTLPLNGDVVTPLANSIPTGSYKELEFKIETPDDVNAETLAFRAAHPAWNKDVSVRVTGTFDAADGSGPQPFEFHSKLDVSPNLKLEPFFRVDGDDVELNLTVSVDVSRWFVDGNGSLVDPRRYRADSNVSGRVDDNIENSFEAFEDHDRDGMPG